MRAPVAEAVEVTPELLLKLRRPLDLSLSPDGKRLAYVVSPAFREKGKAFETRLWIDDATRKVTFLEQSPMETTSEA